MRQVGGGEACGCAGSAGGPRHGAAGVRRARMPPMSSGTRDFQAIGVVGLGTMGAGIAEVFARNGYRVVGVETSDETLERGREHVEHSTARAVKRGKLSEEAAAELVGHIQLTTDLADVKDCDLVVE